MVNQKPAKGESMKPLKQVRNLELYQPDRTAALLAADDCSRSSPPDIVG